MKTRWSTWVGRACAGFILGSWMLLSGGCAVHEGVGYGRGPVPYYDYYYYPDWDVYSYPEGHLYYWNEEGRWHSGPRLPDRYELHEEGREHLRLHTREPWTEHNREQEEPGEEHRR